MRPTFVIMVPLLLIPCLSAVPICEQQAKRIVHRFYPLRHCQRSNRTVIGLANVKTVRECANLARHKQALAFNYAPEGRNRSNLFVVALEREQNSSNRPSPWKPTQLPSSDGVEEGFEDFYNCHVLDCPEYRNLSTIVNDTRFDYYSLYARNLQTKLNYSNAYNSCVSLGGSLAHIVSDTRTFYLAKYISTLPHANQSISNESSTDTSGSFYFVGLNETARDRFFTSSDERLDCFTFRAWAPGHPERNRHPGCAALTDEGSWKVFSCNRSLPYICELHTSGPALSEPKLKRKCSIKRPNNRFAPTKHITN
ncbi:AGAP009316-PA-like protein [Anopheles sinensis]|uniref:AGAP009316-PA-like protein n=1 Tax=Anopheles sinensis TaxID=74873 RepID=A0A084VM64_ANOSI|nr:AGAP009316-PA-like protein [Anopheles sinensis]